MGGESRITNSSVRPPKWAEDGFIKVAEQALDYYNNNLGGHVYRQPRVSELSQGTQQSIDKLKEIASSQGKDLSSLSFLSEPTQSQTNLSKMASGDFLKEGNPYYRQRLTKEVEDSNRLIQSQFAGLGRYGSAMNTDALARNTQSTFLKGYENDYNRALNKMLEANLQIDSANEHQARILNDWHQAQGKTQKSLLEANQIIDRKEQEKLNAQKSAWDEKEEEPWRRLKLLLESTKGAAGSYGEKTTVQQESFLDQLSKLIKLRFR